MKFIANNPVIVGTAIKAVLALGTLFGLKTTEPDRELIVAAIIAVIAAIVGITAKERAAVTPMSKVTGLAQELGGNATKLVDRLTNPLLPK